MNQLGELAYNIWDIEFGDHSSALERERNALLISGYLDVNLGQLNVLVNTDFCLDVEKDKVSPVLGKEEKAILTQLYLKDYLQKQSRNVLRNATSESSTSTQSSVGEWIELREGDTTIKRSIVSASTRNTSAKLLSDSSKEASKLLEKLIHSYNMYGASPLQVAGDDANIQMTESEVLDLLMMEESKNAKRINQLEFKLNATDAEISDVKSKIKSQKISGFAKTFILPAGSDEIFINWSSDYSPTTPPTVLIAMRSRSDQDPIIAHRIEGAPSVYGVNVVFSSKVPNMNYSLEVCAFII